MEAAADAGALAQQIVIEQLKIKPPVTKEQREAIMKKLHQDVFETFYGKVQFGEDGANVAHPPVAVQIQNGKLLNVFPVEFAEARFVPVQTLERTEIGRNNVAGEGRFATRGSSDSNPLALRGAKSLVPW